MRRSTPLRGRLASSSGVLKYVVWPENSLIFVRNHGEFIGHVGMVERIAARERSSDEVDNFCGGHMKGLVLLEIDLIGHEVHCE